MSTDPASAIKREVYQLIDLQIEMLRSKGCPGASLQGRNQ